MWSSWTENAKKAIEKTTTSLSEAERRASEALANAGDAITKAAMQSGSTAHSGDQEFERAINTVEEEVARDSSAAPSVSSTAAGGIALPNIDKEKMMNLWSSVQTSVGDQLTQAAKASKEVLEATKDAVEHSRSNLERQFLKKGFHKRDPKLPLDVEALRDASVVYITDRIITMGHPATASSVNPAITAERKLAAVGHLLNRRHDGRFLVWNLSEVEYDISVLDDQVLTFSFPGSPSPPLGLLLKLLVAMENWMKADERNVAVVHCLTGKGRTSMVTAAFLCWMEEAGFGDINEALAYIANCKQLKPEDLTIPSQRRYASYFKNMLDGVRPAQPPLMLKRIIMSEAPKFAKGPPRESGELKSEGQKAEMSEDEQLMGCAPYLQIFKAGSLVHTSAATLHVHQSEEELPFVQVMDGTVPFNVGQIIQGDVLIRCRHLTFAKKRVSMFRAAFHTGYVPPNVLRLTKSQLDGACSDKRYPDDFFLDLVFEKVDAEALSKHAEGGDEKNDEEDKLGDAKNKKPNAANTKAKGPVVTASAFDTMLQGDSRFWDVIADKRKEVVKKGNDDPFWGPTVGRRRGEPKKDSTGACSEGSDGQKPTAERQAPLPTFSIGNEFDFLPLADTRTGVTEVEPKRDSLMDALNALDEDDGPDHSTSEEIIFGDKPASTTATASDLLASETITLFSNEDESSAAKKEATKEQAATSSPSIFEQTIFPTAQQQEDVMEDDMDALLATTDDDFGDLDLADFDDEGDDLADLEAMLNTS